MILQKKKEKKNCDEQTCSESAVAGRRLQRRVAEAESAMGEGAWRNLWREPRAGQWWRQPKGRTGEVGDRGEVTLPRRVAARGELVAAAAACRRQSLI